MSSKTLCFNPSFPFHSTPPARLLSPASALNSPYSLSCPPAHSPSPLRASPPPLLQVPSAFPSVAFGFDLNSPLLCIRLPLSLLSSDAHHNHFSQKVHKKSRRKLRNFPVLRKLNSFQKKRQAVPLNSSRQEKSSGAAWEYFRAIEGKNEEIRQ